MRKKNGILKLHSEALRSRIYKLMKVTLDCTFPTAITVVSIWFIMLQCFAKYSVSRAAAIIPNYWSFERGFRVSLANTASKTWVGEIFETRNNAVRCTCACGHAAKEGKIKSTESWLDNLLQIEYTYHWQTFFTV